MTIALYWIVFLIINFFATPSPHIESSGCLCSSALSTHGARDSSHSCTQTFALTGRLKVIAVSVLQYTTKLLIDYSTHPHIILYIK